MIYMDPLQLGWEPLVTSWMQTSLPDFMTNEQRDTIRVGGQCKNWHDCVVKVVVKVYRGCRFRSCFRAEDLLPPLSLVLECWSQCLVLPLSILTEVLLYVLRNCRFIRGGSPGCPPRLSHSF